MSEVFIYSTAAELLKDQSIGLQTTYHTPHICGNCMGHIADDWRFCPECGVATGLTAADHSRTQALLEGLMDRVNGEEADP